MYDGCAAANVRGCVCVRVCVLMRAIVHVCACACARVRLHSSTHITHRHNPSTPPPRSAMAPALTHFSMENACRCSTSRVTSHASHLTRHTSHLTPHINTHFWFQIPHTSQCTWKDGACPEFNHMQQKVIRMTCHVSLVMFDVVYVTCDL